MRTEALAAWRTMPDIVIAEFMGEAAVADLARSYDVHYDASLVDRSQELQRYVGEARALIVRNRTQVRGDLLTVAAKLCCIGRLGVGLDNIDVEQCQKRGIAVYPATGANDVSVAEYVLTTAMLLLRGAYGVTPAVVAGTWPRNSVIGREMHAKRLGLIGFGSTARAVALRARSMEMTVGAADPYVAGDDPVWATTKRLDLETLLAGSDVVSLHVPLTAETRNLLDEAAIARMKAGAIVINAARGGIVDEPALCAALRAGRLGGAAIDVFAEEPLDAGSGQRFAGIPNLILTPHIAGVTEESNERVSWLIARKVHQHLEGSR
jgi:(S)-sulfolactate dehydrogenase